MRCQISLYEYEAKTQVGLDERGHATRKSVVFLYMNVKFSKGPGAISKHKSEDIEKSMGRIKKTYICFL